MHTVTLWPFFVQVVNPILQDLLAGLAVFVAGWITYEIHQHAPVWLRGWLEKKAATDLNTALNKRRGDPDAESRGRREASFQRPGEEPDCCRRGAVCAEPRARRGRSIRP
jgi:hypothetical protein